MKKLLLLFSLFYSLCSVAQETNYKEYSYTEFFELIEQETDTVFRLKDALIKYNPETDLRFKDAFTDTSDDPYNPQEKIIVDKRVELHNINFMTSVYNENGVGYLDGVLKDIHFKKDIILNDVATLNMNSCIFDGEFDLETINCRPKDAFGDMELHTIIIRNSTFRDDFSLFKNCSQSSEPVSHLVITNNRFITKQLNSSLSIILYNTTSMAIQENSFEVNGTIRIYGESQDTQVIVTDNNFESNNLNVSFSKLDTRIRILDNQFPTYVNFSIDQLNPRDEIEWSQFKQKLTPSYSFSSYAYDINDSIRWLNLDSLQQVELKREYLDSARYHNKKYYVKEVALKALFYDYYKSQYNVETANEVYLELKDLETKRMQARYEQEQNFKTYFTWKTNQFLKTFSAYGTEPARALIVSLYVILFFALIYLLFPNSWDSHGKKRLMHRFEFFQKYLRRKEGMHTLYLENKQQEVSSYEEFKTNLEQAHLELPKFFITWSKPLYSASMFSSRIISRLLKFTDVLKGKWQDLSPRQRRWKNIQIGFLLLIGLIYDLFIKVLNALMLSINTFTTLGFGEIPIKGLPRYLAIIQGFIGWFMLTIFSVSLISQLLN